MSYCTYLVKIGEVIRRFHSNDIRQCKPGSSENISHQITSAPLPIVSDSQISINNNQDCSCNDINNSQPAVVEVPVSVSPTVSKAPKSNNRNTILTSDIPCDLGTASTSGYTSRFGRVIKVPQKLDL